MAHGEHTSYVSSQKVLCLEHGIAFDPRWFCPKCLDTMKPDVPGEALVLHNATLSDTMYAEN